jgi:hypothetical protein
MEKGWLAFVNGSTKRRLAPFPPDWAVATPAELERLCAAGRVATPRIAGGDARPQARPQKPAGPEGPESSSFTAGDGESVEETVRAFARQARTVGLPAIEAMMRLKALLLTAHPGPDSEARDKRRVRRWFVEAYYFERNA